MKICNLNSGTNLSTNIWNPSAPSGNSSMTWMCQKEGETDDHTDKKNAWMRNSRSTTYSITSESIFTIIQYMLKSKLLSKKTFMEHHIYFCYITCANLKYTGKQTQWVLLRKHDTKTNWSQTGLSLMNCLNFRKGPWK